jgi:hypothetical protein
LAGWLSEQLRDRHNASLQQARAWIDEGRILPLLDGLDENPHRLGCLDAINAFVYDRGGLDPLVVSCRSDDYCEWRRASGFKRPSRSSPSPLTRAA